MKPEDLKYPFSWEERRPLLSQRVLFIPRHYSDHHEWSWGDAFAFGNAKVSIEYCSGNGAWIIAKALSDPHRYWIAVEKRFDRVRKIWSKMENRGLSNLLIVCGEALTFTRHYLPVNSIDEVFVNFPDPWPKGRHAKHRLIQHSFIHEISRVMKAEGRAILVTDAIDYREQILSEFKKSDGWESHFPDPFYVHEWPDYGASYFDALWREKGRLIHYLHFYKKCL
jgi:tRNA (guanine-N7-)-methyltransferase